MQNDCDIYVDPEEDEVFFGCVSEREKNICAKLVKHAGSSPAIESNKILDQCVDVNVDAEKYEDGLNNEQSSNTSLEVFINDLNDSKLVLSKLEKDMEADKILPINTSLESESLFSTPVSQKMDKSILATPKNIVKADKDGGFLKVLSEIALVKAEAEADYISEARKEDEDKENKIISPIPEIKITEATPEKSFVLSPSKSINKELRRFRIIYNSPQNEENVDYKSKSFSENFESEKNCKNKYLDQDVDKVLGIDNKKSVELIDLNDFESGVLNISITLDEENAIQPLNANAEIEEVGISGEADDVCEIITLSESTIPIINENSEADLQTPLKVGFQPPVNPVSVLKSTNTPVNLRFSKEAKKVVEILKKSSVDDTLNFTIPEIDVEGEENSFLSPELSSVFEETLVISNKNLEILPEKTSPEGLPEKTSSKNLPEKTSPEGLPEKTSSKILSEKTSQEGLPEKTSSKNLPEKTSPKNLPEKTSPKILTKPADNKLSMESKIVEKDQQKLTPAVSKSKLLPIKSFSERRIYNKNVIDTKKKCSDKASMEGKKPATAEIVRGSRVDDCNVISCSRIPVFGAKNLKIPVTERAARPLMAKSTHAKTPSGKTYKNSKFNHIESPINAYIHNKPTSLILNVKPELKKDSFTRVLKAQETGALHKVQEKTPNQQKFSNNHNLPFVEYKSATPYKIEKRLESRLPRLAPNVMKLIGSHSPKILKHEGRFYLSTPRKQSSTEATIVADPNEVSIVFSQPVQKSNAIK